MDTPPIPDAAVPLWDQARAADQATFLAMPPAWRLEQARTLGAPTRSAAVRSPGRSPPRNWPRWTRRG